MSGHSHKPPTTGREASPRPISDRLGRGGANALLLTAGLTLLALALLTPPWLACRRLADQRDLMRAQVDQLVSQQARYEAFEDALSRDDPALLERLALTQLGLKPVDTQLVEDGDRYLAPKHLTSTRTHAAGDSGRGRLLSTGDIDRWLLQPLPQPGVDLPRPHLLHSRLTRLTTHPATRAGLIASGIACLLGGLLGIGAESS